MDELDVVRAVGAAEGAPDPDAEADALARLQRVVSGHRSARPRSRRTWAVTVAVSGGVLAVAGLLAASFLTADKHRTAVADTTTYETMALVVERSATDGTWLCVGIHTLEAPPGCGTYRLANWDWSVAPGPITRRRGARWVDGVVLTGTLADRTFTLTKPPRLLNSDDETLLETPFMSRGAPMSASACGADVAGRGRTNRLVRQSTLKRLKALDGVSGVWVSSWPGHPMVVNVRFATAGEDGRRQQAQVKSITSAPICVSIGGLPRTRLTKVEQELRKVLLQGGVMERVGLSTWSLDEASGSIIVQVAHDDGSLQRDVDRRFGVGVVRIVSALKRLPIDPASLEAFWRPFHNRSEPGGPYRTLRQVFSDSSLVVRGRIVDVSLDRGATSGATRTIATLQVRVTELILGDAAAGTTIAVAVPVRGTAKALDELHRHLPRTDVVLFLAHDGSKWRPVSYAGIWTATTQGEVATPIASLVDVGEIPIVDVAGIEHLDQLVAATHAAIAP